METGVLGQHGALVVSLAEEAFKQEQETVTALRHTMEERLVKGHHQKLKKLKLAAVKDVHKVRKNVFEYTVNITIWKDQDVNESSALNCGVLSKS